MKSILSILVLALTIPAFAQEYSLVGESAYCTSKASLVTYENGYGFRFEPGFQEYSSTGGFFYDLNKGRVCTKNTDTNGEWCHATTGTESPLNLTTRWCYNMLPVPCSGAQTIDSLVQSDQGQLVYTHKDLRSKEPKTTVCTYEKSTAEKVK
jgi:hypothetical protein